MTTPEQIDRRTQELIILNRIAEALNREVDLSRALNSALRHIVELFNLRTAWIFLREEKSGKYYTAAALHLPPALADHPRRMGGTCYCLDMYDEGDMADASNIDAITCSRLEHLRVGTEGLRYHASIPLYMTGKQPGILNVASPDWREISEDDLRLLHTVGDLLSMAIERARLFQQSSELGAMEERNRLAREIHDTIAQSLAAMTLQLEAADALLDNNAERDRIKQAVTRSLQLARSSMEEARRSVQDLRAAPLEGRTLPEAIRALLADEELQATLSTHSEVMGSSPPLSVRLSVALFRIAQEAINNVKKHAGATRLNIQLILMPEYVRLIVEDNGKGFDTTCASVGRYGLVGIQERAKLLGGKADIASVPGSGTIIEVSIPLEK